MSLILSEMRKNDPALLKVEQVDVYDLSWCVCVFGEGGLAFDMSSTSLQ